jgi:hypothetical protein
VTKGHDQVHVYTVLLKEAPKDKIDTLDPPTFRHVLRKRLQRAGLGKVPMIGGFEVVYRAKKGVWVLDAAEIRQLVHLRFHPVCPNTPVGYTDGGQG